MGGRRECTPRAAIQGRIASQAEPDRATIQSRGGFLPKSLTPQLPPLRHSERRWRDTVRYPASRQGLGMSHKITAKCQTPPKARASSRQASLSVKISSHPSLTTTIDPPSLPISAENPRFFAISPCKGKQSMRLPRSCLPIQAINAEQSPQSAS